MPGLPEDDRRRFEATRLSLVERLGDWKDQARWEQFFETYSGLIYNVARRAGLSDAEAQDVVQETTLSIARNVTRYDRNAGSFKSWLLQTTRWRIADQFRKRLPEGPASTGVEPRRGESAIDNIPAPEAALDDAWDAEWRERLLSTALECVKRKASPAHYQIFDCALRKRWSARKIASELKVNIAQVYLVKHRLGAQLKKELKNAEEGE